MDDTPATIFDVHYEYDKVGNRLTQRIDEETYWDERYYYDSLYRLEEMKRGHVYQSNGEWVVSNVQRTEDWSLDLLGNWSEYDVTGDETISEDRTHNVLNEITDIDQTSLTYDLQGNLTGDGTKTYEWDIAGRLKKVSEGETVLAEMAYDAYGRRVTKDDGDDVFHYYYDGWRVIEEYTDDGENTTLSARNVWGLYLDELVVRTDVNAGDDLYPVANPIYSPLRYYDGSGTLVARVRYTPYGKPSLVDSGGNGITPTESDYPILFTGQRRDVETALYYYKNRYHSPTLGRFLSRDRISELVFGLNTLNKMFINDWIVADYGHWQDILVNQYLFVSGSPTTDSDRSGLARTWLAECLEKHGFECIAQMTTMPYGCRAIANCMRDIRTAEWGECVKPCAKYGLAGEALNVVGCTALAAAASEVGAAKEVWAACVGATGIISLYQAKLCLSDCDPILQIGNMQINTFLNWCMSKYGDN